MKVRPRIIRFLLLGAAVVVVLGLAGIAAWQFGVRPAFEAAIFRATGWKADVGGLSPGWRRLVARNVTLLGVPPFEQTPLAKIARLEITLGGSLWSPRPTVIVADSAVITYLAIGVGPGAMDNVRGTTGPRIGGAGSLRGSAAPELRLVHSRFEAFVRFDASHRTSVGKESLAVRGDRMDAVRHSDGRTSVRWEGVVLDVLGAVTVRAPRLEATRQAGIARFSARDLAVAVPGAGNFLRADNLDLLIEPDGATVTLQSAAARPAAVPSADARPASATNSPGTMEAAIAFAFSPGKPWSAVGDVALKGLPISALAPLLRRANLSVAAGRASLDAHLTPPPPDADAGSVTGSVRASVEGLDVHHPRLDRAPWTGIAFDLETAGSYVAPTHKLTIADGHVTALGLGAGVSGWVTLEPALAGELRISPPPKTGKACAEALNEWPATMRTRLAGLVVSGRLGATGRLRFDARNWDDLEVGLAFSPLCNVVAEPTAITRLNQGALPLALPEFVPLKALPSHVVGAFLTAEDGGFRRHHGFDVEMIRRALAHDFAMGTLSKGASTLSQQVAKNLFLTPERTIARKLAELVLTWRLEQVLGKDRILELYLNIVELGPNLRGLGAASVRYFGKPAAALSPLEAAHLASLLPNPNGFARRFREGRVDDGWLHKLYDLLGRMQRSGLLTSEALQRARSETLALRKL